MKIIATLLKVCTEYVDMIWIVDWHGNGNSRDLPICNLWSVKAKQFSATYIH